MVSFCICSPKLIDFSVVSILIYLFSFFCGFDLVLQLSESSHCFAALINFPLLIASCVLLRRRLSHSLSLFQIQLGRSTCFLVISTDGWKKKTLTCLISLLLDTRTESPQELCRSVSLRFTVTYQTAQDCDAPCSPAVCQNDRPQAAAAHSVRSHTHTHTHTLIYSLVIRLSSDAVDQPFVGDDSVAVDLQRELFGLAPLHLAGELTLESFNYRN